MLMPLQTQAQPVLVATIFVVGAMYLSRAYAFEAFAASRTVRERKGHLCCEYKHGCSGRLLSRLMLSWSLYVALGLYRIRHFHVVKAAIQYTQSRKGNEAPKRDRMPVAQTGWPVSKGSLTIRFLDHFDAQISSDPPVSEYGPWAQSPSITVVT
jgi:hypothetical protein